MMPTPEKHASRKSSNLVARLAREPLLHFLALGALVFGTDQLILAGRGDPDVITVNALVDEEARGVFRASMNRDPSADDMKILRERWIDSEVLYREALALGLDRGDSSIRDRLIFKALSITQAGLDLPQVNDADLRQWFEANRSRYDEPQRYDFLEAVLTDGSTPEQIERFTAALQAGKQGEDPSTLRVFKGRPRDNLLQSYGEDFTAGLEKLAPEQWTALPSAVGPRVVRLQAITPGVPADFEAIKAEVYADWKDDTLQRLATAKVREMGKKYRVEVPGDAT
jgi:hypothetical protein